MNRPALARLAAYGLIVLAGTGGMWRVETTANQAQAAAEDAQRALAEIEAERLVAAERSCSDAAETRTILRGMVRDGGITSGVTSGITAGEALIAVILSGGEPDEATQAAIDAYREQLSALLPPALDPALVEVVNELPDRRWDPEAQVCVDVPVEE